jgi:hypothetical protein
VIVARWNIVAKFGHASEAISLLKAWDQDFGRKAGFPVEQQRMLQGSVGAKESLIQSEVPFENLAEMEAAFAKLATFDGHAQWSEKMAPHVVSGTNLWEVFRVV